MPNENKMLIVDVSNLLHRCYHVYKHLTNKKGIKTGTIFGFLNMLLFYSEKTKINNMILVWDTPSETNWRLSEYPEYKSNRRHGTEGDPTLLPSVIIRTKNDLKKAKNFKDKKILENKLENLEKLRDLIHAKKFIWNITEHCGFINIIKEGYEADDIAGMLVKKFRKNIKLITCDKDYLQLVDDKNKIRVYKPMMGKNDGNLNKSYTVYNENKVLEEFGVLPKDFHNLLAITGDSCDGIEGIKGYSYKRGSKLWNDNKGELEKALDVNNYNIYERNLILVNLHSLPGELVKSNIFVQNKNTKQAQAILDDLEIKKFKAKELSKLNTQEFTERILKRF